MISKEVGFEQDRKIMNFMIKKICHRLSSAALIFLRKNLVFNYRQNRPAVAKPSNCADSHARAPAPARSALQSPLLVAMSLCLRLRKFESTSNEISEFSLANLSFPP